MTTPAGGGGGYHRWGRSGAQGRTTPQGEQQNQRDNDKLTNKGTRQNTRDKQRLLTSVPSDRCLCIGLYHAGASSIFQPHHDPVCGITLLAAPEHVRRLLVKRPISVPTHTRCTPPTRIILPSDASRFPSAPSHRPDRRHRHLFGRSRLPPTRQQPPKLRPRRRKQRETSSRARRARACGCPRRSAANGWSRRGTDGPADGHSDCSCTPLQRGARLVAPPVVFFGGAGLG